MAESIGLSGLRVLLVAPLPPPYGGICFLTKALLDAGLGQGLELVHLNTSKNTIREDVGRVSWLDVRLAVRNFMRFCYLLAIDRPHIVHLITTADTAVYRDWLFVLAAKLAGCRILLHLHGTRVCTPFASRSLHRAFVRGMASMASYIVVPNEVDLEGLQKTYFIEVPAEVIRNTVSVPLRFRNPREVPSGRPGASSWVAVGRMSEAKGAWDLFQAFALVLREESNLRLVWIGLGAFPADDDHARELRASLGIADHVQLAGQLSEEEKFRELQQADAFVLPTHSEGFPLALLEAMAMGLPVVTTPVGGIPEVVKDGVNGYLVQPRDVNTLAERILALLRDPLKCRAMGQANAVLYWESLSAQKAVARFHSLFSEMSDREVG